MAKAVYVGVGSKAHKMKKAYIGVGGKARKVKKMYIGVGGKARLCYSAELERYGMAAALSAARDGMRAATVGKYALFAGGYGRSIFGYSVSSSVDAYNTSLTKSTPTELSCKRCGHAAASVGGYTHLHDSTLVECCTSECERRKCRQLRTVRWRTDHCFLYDSGRLQCFAHPHHRDRSEQRGKQQRRCNCREPRNICGQHCLRRHLRCLPHQNVCRHPEHGAVGSGCNDSRRLRYFFRKWCGRLL